MKVKEAINALNNKRKERLKLLLEYIEDQGQFTIVMEAGRNVSTLSNFQLQCYSSSTLISWFLFYSLVSFYEVIC